jgi:glucan phosphorylase
MTFSIFMAHGAPLGVIAAHTVNGVAKIHSAMIQVRLGVLLL